MIKSPVAFRRIAGLTQPVVIVPGKKDKASLGGGNGNGSSRPRGGGGGSAAGTLDDYTTGLWSAASFDRKVLSAYGGNARTTRRSSDSTTQTVGFSGSAVDAAAELAFVGANSGFASVVNDQSGSARNWEQATAAAQLRTVLTGVTDGFGLSCYSSAQRMQSNTSIGAGVSAITVFLKMNRVSAGAATQIIMEQTPNLNTNDGFYFAFINGVPRVLIGRNSTAITSSKEYSTALIPTEATGVNNGPVIAIRLNIAEAVNIDKIKLYKDGVLQTHTGTPSTGVVTGNFDNLNYYLGSRSDGTFGASVRFQDMAIYHAALSDAQIAAISAALV